MAGISAVHSRHDPVSALLAAGRGAVLAVIAETSGPSYRPVGAMMAVLGRKEWVGTLSSGCVEADIALHALEARSDGKPRFVAYGKDSPFMDIQLPCGGGLKILLVPNPDLEVLENLKEHQSQRRGITLEIEVNTGRMQLTDSGKCGLDKNILRIRIEPELQFFVFGKGSEAGQFAALVQTLGYDNLLLSPDDETLGAGDLAGCDTRLLTGKNYPKDLAVDHRTAIVLFFHDHDWEPPILVEALATPAFYVGAQGSKKAQDARREMLASMGIAGETLERLRGPIGLIPSARDARTLAVSVLAEVLAVAMKTQHSTKH